jgi:hypothetical protein
MRKLHIIQSIILAVLTIATIYITIQGDRLYQAQQYKQTPKPAKQATPIDTEKQQLQREIQVLREDNELLKWYMDTFFSQAQRAYMKARGKK